MKILHIVQKSIAKKNTGNFLDLNHKHLHCSQSSCFPSSPIKDNTFSDECVYYKKALSVQKIIERDDRYEDIPSFEIFKNRISKAIKRGNIKN